MIIFISYLHSARTELTQLHGINKLIACLSANAGEARLARRAAGALLYAALNGFIALIIILILNLL